MFDFFEKKTQKTDVKANNKHCNLKGEHLH